MNAAVKPPNLERKDVGFRKKKIAPSTLKLRKTALFTPFYGEINRDPKPIIAEVRRGRTAVSNLW